MSRLAALLRMGYFPLPEPEARRIRRHLHYPASKFTALDPCAGEGKALAAITEGVQGQRCGIELDAYRAEESTKRLDQAIYGDCFGVDCHVECCSVLYLNPPYQPAAHEDEPSQRLEEMFLQRTYRWLKPGGVLILIIPIAQLAVCGNILCRQFKDTAVYRLTEPARVEYHQIVVFAVRRSRRERERLHDRDITVLRLDYGRKARSFETLPALPDQPQRVYAVPEAEPIELVHHGLPLDEIEDALPQSSAYRQAQRILFAPESRKRGRPLSPLHQGHVGLLACASALDGIFGENDLKHIWRWQAVKVVTETQEEDERGVVMIHQRESFSHCLNLLYVDGEVAVLTAEAPSSTEKQTSTGSRLSTTRMPIESPEGTGRKFRIEEDRGEEHS